MPTASHSVAVPWASKLGFLLNLTKIYNKKYTLLQLGCRQFGPCLGGSLVRPIKALAALRPMRKCARHAAYVWQGIIRRGTKYGQIRKGNFRDGAKSTHMCLPLPLTICRMSRGDTVLTTGRRSNGERRSESRYCGILSMWVWSCFYPRIKKHIRKVVTILNINMNRIHNIGFWDWDFH
jgi:hypothetical protein